MAGKLKIYIIFILCGYCKFTLYPQNISAAQDSLSFANLVDIVESKTRYKIYYIPHETEEVKVLSGFQSDDDPVEFLKETLENTGLRISLYEDMIFILKEKEIITSLILHEPDSERIDMPGSFIGSPAKEVKATSENMVYEIGNKSQSMLGKPVLLSGIITDFKTGEPVPGVNIYSHTISSGAVTDRDGFYSLHIPPGRHELLLQGLGIKNTSRQVIIYSEGKLNIELEEKVLDLDEITVSSERLANVRSTAMGVERLKIKEIKNIPGLFGETDIIRVVMALPGVKTAGELSSGFNVRGGSTDQNLILFNEGTIYNPTHLFGMFSVFNPDMVDNMEFYKSTIPARYGGRISSVLEINGKEADKEKFTGSASISLLTSRLSLEIPLIKNKTSLMLGGRTTYSDWLLSLLPEKSGYKNGKAGFYDMNLMLSHQWDEKNNLYISAYYSHDSFSFNTEEQYTYRNANASVKWRNAIRTNLIGSYAAGYDHYDYATTDESHKPAAYRLTFGINQVFAKAGVKWMMHDNHTLSFGLNSLLYLLSPGSNQPIGHESLIKKEKLQMEKALETALYTGYLWDITHKWSVDAVLRISMYNMLGKKIIIFMTPLTCHH